MSTKDYTKNLLIRLLCAIMLLVVQSDLLACESNYLNLLETSEVVFHEQADDSIQDLDTDDYYRQAPRSLVRLQCALFLLSTCLPDLYINSKTTVVYPECGRTVWTDPACRQAVYCVFRI